MGCTARELWPARSPSASVTVAIRYRSADPRTGTMLEQTLAGWIEGQRRIGADPARDLRAEPKVDVRGAGTWDVVFEGLPGSDAWNDRLVEFGVVAARRSPLLSSAFLVDRASGEERPTFFEA